MKLSRVSVFICALVCAACTTVAPVASPSTSTPLPVTAAPVAVGTPSGAPIATSAPQTAPPESALPSEAPVDTATPTPTPSPTPSPTPKPTPKPTKKPTPTPSPTPTPQKEDLAIYVNTSDIPNPWYNNTDYTLPIHVSAAISDIPGAQVKVSIPEEAFSTSYTTGAITAGSEDVHNVTINVPAIGPATLILSVKVPAGFSDVNPGNNKVSIAINVQLAP